MEREGERQRGENRQWRRGDIERGVSKRKSRQPEER